MSTIGKKPRFVELSTSNENIKFIVAYEPNRWLTQISINGKNKYPILPSKVPLFELNDARNKNIAKLLQVNKIEDDGLIEELMEVAGQKAEELMRLMEPEEEVTSPEQKYDSKIVERANYILEKGDPFQFYLDKWKSSYAITDDDDSIGALTLCVIASTQISKSDGIHEKVGGPSGFGKSSGITTMFKLFPPEKTLVSSMSAKALFYTELPDGTVVYCDDIDLSDVNFFTTVKQSTSDYQQVTKHTTVNNGSSLKCSTARRIGWILSSVDNFTDEQLDSRFGETEVNDDIDKQQAIYQKQKDKEKSKVRADKLDDDTLVCQYMWDIIALGGLYDIVIPFVESIKWADIQRPRSWPFFSDIIRCYTLFKIKQRDQYNGIYMATVEDFEAARDMYKKMEHINATKLNTKEIAVLTYIPIFDTFVYIQVTKVQF